MNLLYARRTSKFQKSDAFIGFQKDTPASVIFQATNLLRSACAAAKEGDVPKKGKWADIFKWSQLEPENCCIEESSEDQTQWKNAVRTLLCMSPPADSLWHGHCNFFQHVLILCTSSIAQSSNDYGGGHLATQMLECQWLLLLIPNPISA